MWRWLVLLAGCGRIDFAPLAVPDSPQLTYRDAVLADHPLAYWRLDDNDATSRDVTGSFPGTYDGTCMHDVPGALTGDPDPATHSDGGCTMSATGVPSFAGVAAFAIEVWYSADTLSRTERVMKETRQGGLITGSPVDGYTVFISGVGAYLERVVATNIIATTPTPVSAQAFHYLVGTYDGVQLAFYIDGTLVATQSDSRSAAATTVPLQVGGYGTPPVGDSIGTYDEIAIYDYALPPDRIALHHDLGVNGPR
jgi:hypothetical protein